MKKVLVIMATYNGEKFLREQLNSILLQKNVQVNILVRDDGSQDGTKRILEDYKKNKKLTWYTGSHLNVQKGYFELMKKAASLQWDYIAFSDQDDVWDNDKLDVAVSNLEKFSDNLPLLYYCGQRLVDQNLNYIADHTLNEKRTLITRFVLSDFAGCTGVFNRNLLNLVLEYEPRYMLMHDTWILKICLAVGGNVIVDDGMHMSYRQHGNNSLGLGRGLRANLRQANQYINYYKVEPQMRELLNGYEGKMLPIYRELAKNICEYRFDINKKIKLLNKRNINFYNKGLNLTFAIKILLNKL